MDQLRAIALQFAPSVWNRGLEVWQHGRVQTLVWNDDDEVWTARVRGTSAPSYAVWASFDAARTGGVVEGDCECPAPKPCKHMAAVVYAALMAEERDLPSAQRPGTTDRRQFAAWAESARRAVEVAAAEKPQGPRKEILYIVDIDTRTRHGDRRARVTIEPNAVTLRKDGSRGVVQPYDLTSSLLRWPGQRPNWLSEVDLTLWFRLQTLWRHEYASYGAGLRSAFPHHPDAAGLFAEFVATGRCRLERVDGLALVGAAARPGRVAWNVGADGLQRLQVEPADGGAGWFILPLLPLHFCDERTGACGPIELDIPAPLGPWLVAVPPVDPELAHRFPDDLREMLAASNLPPPRPLQLVGTGAAEVTPVLRLGALRRGEDSRPFAELSFDYGGVRVRAGEHGSHVFRVQGEQISRVERDRKSELRAHRRLVGLGFHGPAYDLAFPDLEGWLDFTRSGIPVLEREGWRIEIDDDFEWYGVDVDRWIVQTIEADEDEGSAGSAWFLQLGVEVDGERIDILPLLVAAIREGRIGRDRVRLDGQPVVLPLPDGRRLQIEPGRLEAMLDVLVELHDERALPQGPVKLSGPDALAMHALEGWDLELAPKLRAFVDRLRAGPMTPVDPPAGLQATLRDYQRRGLDWLQWLREGGLGGVLADDMGLGKTVQALAHLLVEKDAGRLDRPALVVAPRSVLRNWQREAERFTPQLRTTPYHGSDRARVLATLDAWDVVVTTYALLQRDRALRDIEWHVVILDEAQAIKNPSAKVAAAARDLDARQRLCMTGTPMENNLGDLWSLMSFANPGLLGTSRQFAAWYRGPIERQGDVLRLDALVRRVSPFMLRRTKAQVLGELPPKTEIVLHAELAGPQRDLYESVRLTMEKRVRDELAARGLARSQIVVLDALLKLRQVCCHPPLVKLQRATQVRKSAKLELLGDLVRELVAEGRRALVFSQFTSMLAVIEHELVKLGIPWLSITGKTEARQEIVDRFQAGEVPVLLVSLKAGGTGLNLTAADTVIHYDPWWNPAVEAQATDRAHRIGQSQPVTVYRLICEGTVEERMLALQARKAALLRGIQSSAERRAATGFTLDASDIAELLAPLRA